MTPIRTINDIIDTNQLFWLDTGVLMTAYSSYASNPYKKEIKNLLLRLASNDALFVTSTETGTEIIKGLRTSILRPYYNKGLNSKQVIAACPQLNQDLQKITKQILKDYEELPSTYEQYCGHTGLTLLELQFSAEANIGNMDARQIIAAKSCGVTNFITTDKGIAQVNDLDFNIYLPVQAYNECIRTISTSTALTIPCWNEPKA